MNCEHRDGECTFCKQKMLFDELRLCPRRSGRICSHLGPRKLREGVPLAIRCGCSGESVNVELPVHNCDRFKRCLPTFRPTDEQRKELAKQQSDATLFKWCCDCELNPINQPQPA